MIGVQTDLFGAVTTAADGRRGYLERRTYRLAEVRVQTLRESAAPMAVRTFSTSRIGAEFWREVVARAPWFDADKEQAVVVMMNRKMHLIGWNLLSIGTASATLVSPREALRVAIVANASAFLLMHNHPSGDPAPSRADVEITRQIRAAAEVVEVSFCDHIIVGEVPADPLGLGYYSFRDGGLFL